MRQRTTALFVGAMVSAVGINLAAAAPHSVMAPGSFAGDLRALPVADDSQPAPEKKEGPERRITHPEALLLVPQPQDGPDTLVELQRAARRSGFMRVYSPPELNFDAAGFSGVYPPDTNGDIGSNYFIQTINHGGDGTRVTVFNKTTGAVAAGPFALDSLWTAGGNCADGGGDPVVLYDQLASRWLLTEFTQAGNELCIYVSRNNDPLTGGWSTYVIEAPNFPDYPKYSVWPDAYYITTNEPGDAPIYALDRAKMLAGQPATSQRFEVPSLNGFGFQALTPVDADGSTPPPATSNAFFVRHKDDEVHPPAVGGSDRIEVWELHVDWAVPANSALSLASSIAVSEFESELCGTSGTECIPQPMSGPLLDPLREVVMWRAQYRNFGTHQSLVGNFVTDADGGSADHAGIRWFELRRMGLGAWSLHQEGTYAPDSHHRWMGSIAMDGAGNMAMGFSRASATVNAGIRYTGRLAADPLGVMTQAEINAASGTDAQAADRWGDYASMSVDPINDCTFWFTTEYATLGDWQTRVTRLRYDPPVCVDATAPVCGNNTKEVGEDCDGTDSAYCSGLCAGSCTCPAPACGNNVVEVGEHCDGASAGVCPGACDGDCTCDLCGSTPELPANCFLQNEPGRASVSISDVADNSRDKIKWTWGKGVATSISDFGGPSMSGAAKTQFCVFDASANPQPLQSASVAPGGVCGDRLCWKTTRSGYTYKNKTGNADGITALTLKAGDAGKSSVKVSGKGTALNPPNPDLTLPVTVQLMSFDGSNTRCWQTQYSAASANDDEKFKAKGP